MENLDYHNLRSVIDASDVAIRVASQLRQLLKILALWLATQSAKDSMKVFPYLRLFQRRFERRRLFLPSLWQGHQPPQLPRDPSR